DQRPEGRGSKCRVVSRPADEETGASMSVASAEFLVAVLFLSAVYFRLPTGTARRVVLAVCNAGFLALFLPNLVSVFALAAFLLSGYLVAILLRRHWSAAVFTGYLVLLVGAFIVLKKYEF